MSDLELAVLIFILSGLRVLVRAIGMVPLAVGCHHGQNRFGRGYLMSIGNAFAVVMRHILMILGSGYLMRIGNAFAVIMQHIFMIFTWTL